VADLRAEEVGGNIVVRFTTPEKTTEDLPIAQLRSIQLDVEADGASLPYEVAVTPLGPREREIPAGQWAGKQIALTLRTVGPSGGTSDISNRVTLDVVAPLEQPRVTPRNTAEGVVLTWTGNAPLYRVQRSVPNDPKPEFEQIAETDKREFTDVNTADGVRYIYVVTGFQGAARSVASEQTGFTPQDTFPPSVPTGLTAVALNGAVDLSWTRNTEADFLGYTVLKAEGDAALQVIAEGVVLPTFSDRQVERGKRYRYALIAVDQKKNASARSAEQSVTVE
jgi:fibronectin type 3 domain-containing protein